MSDHRMPFSCRLTSDLSIESQTLTLTRLKWCPGKRNGHSGWPNSTSYEIPCLQFSPYGLHLLNHNLDLKMINFHSFVQIPCLEKFKTRLFSLAWPHWHFLRYDIVFDFLLARWRSIERHFCLKCDRKCNPTYRAEEN